jgi:hypothetical protein
MWRARGGQTLLEGIIAIFVVTVGLMAVIGLAISNNTNAQLNNDRAIATALAREGLEVAKHVRDSNWLAGAPFSQGLLVGDDGTTPLTSNIAAPQLTFDNNAPAWNLDFVGADYGDLTHDNTLVSWLETGGQQRFAQVPGGLSGRATKFHRNLTFSALCQATDARGTSFAYTNTNSNVCASGVLIGIKVISKVQWQQALGPRSVILELRLFDWR